MHSSLQPPYKLPCFLFSLLFGRGRGPLPLQWEGEGIPEPVNQARYPLIFPSQTRATGPFFSQGRREEGKLRPRKMCDSFSLKGEGEGKWLLQ